MRKAASLFLIGALALAASGCTHIGSQTNLADVASRAGLANVTTGDGTFENYTATSYHTGKEFGIALGFGFWKFMELYPFQSNEDQLLTIATEAKAMGGDAMINVQPHKEIFIGFPFIIIGLYLDSVEGTGIKSR